MTELATITCISCKGLGYLEVEVIDVGRPKYRQGHLVYKVEPKDKWEKMVCYCVKDKQ
jgi:hypothetical protein